MKYSKQKDEILKLMRSGKLDHPRAADVYVAMKKILPDIGIATVYRNLNSLADAGLIRRIAMPGEADIFDHRLDAHHHAVCEKCGKVFDFYLDRDGEITAMLKDTIGFEASEISCCARGRCAACR